MRATLVLCLLAGACADPSQTPDASSPTEAGVDAARIDAAAHDSGSHPADAGLADAGRIDAGPEDAGARDAGPTLSRCVDDGVALRCAHHTETLRTGFTGLVPRQVHWQVPLGAPPSSGWPVAIVFQGSFVTAALFWEVTAASTDTFGHRNQVRVVRALLDRGFAVLTPEAKGAGTTAWDTNIPPASLAWESSADHRFMLDLFAAIDEGRFGVMDPARWYATGISSGGYMSSRMDQAYRSRFAAIAIHSASYATCGGALCVVPDSVDAAHLPTLFLHGTADAVVPIATMETYRDRLEALGVPTDTVTEPTGHAWLDAAAERIPNWFEMY